jgi:hypothetical protein
VTRISYFFVGSDAAQRRPAGRDHLGVLQLRRQKRLRPRLHPGQVGVCRRPGASVIKTLFLVYKVGMVMHDNER